MTTSLDPVTETLLDNIASLWVQRRAMAAAPHARLADLVRLDERLDASLEAGLAVAMVMDGAGAERYLHGTGLATDAHRARPPPTVVLDVEARA